MIASSAPTSTVSSSATTIFCRTPETGDGISVSTLSVETSSNGSSAMTWSPSCLSQRVTGPSDTLSPSAGMVTEVPPPPPEPPPPEPPSPEPSSPEDACCCGASCWGASCWGASCWGASCCAGAASCACCGCPSCCCPCCACCSGSASCCPCCSCPPDCWL